MCWVSAVGAPYDTLLGVIGTAEKGHGSLKDYGVEYRQVELVDDAPDLEGIARMAADPKVKAVLIQRSKGYSTRASLSVAEIGEMCAIIKRANPNAAILVDNCYGEFVETLEPTHVGADLVVGSLIKNPGGGLAPTGGYIAGRRRSGRGGGPTAYSSRNRWGSAAVLWARTVCFTRDCFWPLTPWLRLLKRLFLAQK